MMQRWGSEAVRFMRDASEYGTYHTQLAQHLLPYLPRDGHVCDAGCGLGYLSLALAKHCKQVTAVDASEAALRILRENQPPQNLRILHGDILTMQERYDAMVFCYFGHTNEILQLAKQCSGNIVVIKRDCSQHTFSLGAVTRKAHSIDRLCDTLTQMGISFFSETLRIELGQPFASLEDAVRFFELYNKSENEVHIEEVQMLLQKTNRNDFPWYLPSCREMELIVFSAKDVYK